MQLHIETPQGFIANQQENKQEKQQKNQQHVPPSATVQHYSDDAFSYFAQDAKSQVLMCYIAITDSEIILLEQQKKLLEGLLKLKLQKVLNLIAKQLKLNSI